VASNNSAWPCTLVTRGASVVTKAAELSALGVATGGVFHAVNTGLVKLHKGADPAFEPSVPVPDLKTSMLGRACQISPASSSNAF